jgi:hypothetical protein
VPAGSVLGVTVNVLQAGCSVNESEPVQLFASVAVMVNVREAVLVGVPEIVLPLNVKPAGNVPEVTLNV